MPGFPDKFMPFMDEPPGAKFSSDHHRVNLWQAHSQSTQVDTKHGQQGTILAAQGQGTDDRLPGTMVTTTKQDQYTVAYSKELVSWLRKSKREETPTPPSQLVEMSWDPITRIVGSLGIYTKIDFKKRKVVECHSTSSIFRGYSLFMQGKDPRDAHFITSRICGICGDNHATCSVYTQNMAYGVKAPSIRRVDSQPG